MKTKRIVSLSVLLSMLLSLSACGNNGSPSGNSGSAFGAEESSVSGGGRPQTVEDKELYEFTMMGNLTAEMTDNDRAYIKGLEDTLNLKINVELPPSTSYTESLQMMLVSGEYPELVLFPSATDTVYVDAVRNGVFLPLDSYLETAENLKAYTYEVSWDGLKVLSDSGDNQIYGVPRTSITRADGFFIRQDWIDNLGLAFDETKPLTLVQLEEFAEAFTKNDPDGNGVNDTYGISAASDADGNITPLFPWTFGLIGWSEYDGEYMDLKYSKTHDNYKRALEWNNKMWEAGYIDPDWPTVKRDIQIERFQKGITGIHNEFAGWMTDNEKKGRELNEGFSISYITGIVENEGDRVEGGSFSTGFWGLWSIASTAEKPQRIVGMLDYMLSDDYWDNTKYGMEGYAWNEENGVKVATENYSTTAMGRAILRRNNDPQFFVALNQSAEERGRVESLIQTCIDQYIFTLDRGYRPAISDDPVFIDYQKNMNVQISKIIVGELPVSEWDAILDGWYKAGGETYIKQMQDNIAKYEK